MSNLPIFTTEIQLNFYGYRKGQKPFVLLQKILFILLS
jgi:hypothetical protein